MEKERLTSLDAFRGLTIAAMILVNNPGDGGHVYWPLDHAPWHGWTPTDLIFPFFLFMVGMALPFSRRTRGREALRRALVIAGLGLFMAAYPYFDLTTVRIPGVLVRIALCYFAAWWVRRLTGPAGQAGLAATLAKHGGQRYEIVSVRFEGPSTRYSRCEVHRQTVLTVRGPDGVKQDLRLFGSSVEEGGAWKVFSYVLD